MIAVVIDLGTNTSNLVVASIRNPLPEILFQGKEYVRLGDERISEHVISDPALQRTLDALGRQVETARHFKADKIRIIATSAVRHAVNRNTLIQSVKSRTGIDIEVIDGDREATLIYYGVKLALKTVETPSAILDIGGGSNEIIIFENGTVNWQGSFAAGMSRIINTIPISNPITPDEEEYLTEHFRQFHSEALEQCRKFGVKTLIGCSGAFNTLADIIDGSDPEQYFRQKKEISLNEFGQVYRQLLPTTTLERQQIKGMDPVRTELIVPALILSKTFIEHTPVSGIIQTSYALREGVLYEMLNVSKDLPQPEGSS
jgi:exopolyphosphatase/guanosine-5'-triphosphate,3'-diphosphate pyrophosphatase